MKSESLKNRNNRKRGRRRHSHGKRSFRKISSRTTVDLQLERNNKYCNNIARQCRKAVRKVVEANAIRCEFDDKRNMSILELNSAKGFPQVIVSEDGKTAENKCRTGIYLPTPTVCLKNMDCLQNAF